MADFLSCPVCDGVTMRYPEYDLIEKCNRDVVRCVDECGLFSMHDWEMSPRSNYKRYRWRLGLLSGDWRVSRREFVVARHRNEPSPEPWVASRNYKTALEEAKTLWASSDLMAFVRACQAAPADTAPPLVFADYLEERGLCPLTLKAIRKLQEAPNAGH